MNAEKYIINKERLNNALNGRLESITNDIKEVLEKYNIEFMKELSYDVFCFLLETLHLDKLDIDSLKTGTLEVKESTLIEQIMREQLGLLHERSKEVNPLELAELTHQMINIVEFLAEYY
ncbi:MAG: hypothetical protein HFE57_05570 [Firmicutes bacterium]|jgi:septum formation topological specificity factor MinE|nr:hypothetical protein [Bacillota bacterium]